MKIFLRWACLVLLVFFALLAPKILNRNKKTEEQAKTVLVLWHIDTFEGGTGSRQDFLMKSAIEFEKNNPNVYVSVIAHTEESVKQNFSNDVVPDMLSFGLGVYDAVNYAIPLKSRGNDVFFDCAKVENKQIFYPYAYGKYLLFTMEEAKGADVIISKGKRNLPLFALNLCGKSFQNALVKSSIEGYTSFVSGKYKNLLGTQRDLYRLTKRGISFSCEEVGDYTDLVQYIAVTSKQKDKETYSQKFAEYLISNEVQSRLGEIGLFSTTGANVDYGIEQMNTLSKIKPNKIFSPFIDEMNHSELLLNDGQKNFCEKFENYLR